MLRNLKSKVLVTTPIYYINNKPHIGHIYTLLYSEFVKKTLNSQTYHNIRGQEIEAYLSTGVDEHGKKVFNASQEAGIPVKEYSDKYAALFREAVDMFEIDYDHFQRTTDGEHIENVENLWTFFDGKGYFSQKEYSGYYNISDEEFIKERDLKNYR